METPLAQLSQAQATLQSMAVAFAPKLLTALLILVVGYFVTAWLGRMAAGSLSRIDLEPPVRQLLLRIVRFAIFALFLVLALQNLGIQLLPLIAGLSIAGAGVALAMQGVLSNVAAGLTIIFTRPFRVGEYISIAGEEGVVDDVSIFSTRLRHADLSAIVIPNRKIAGEILHNYGTLRQLDLRVAVAYDTDLNHALAVAQEVLAANPRALREPAPVTGVVRLADSSVEIAVRPWVGVQDFGPAGGEINQALVQAFRSRHIVIALPQREVRLLAGQVGA